jgi:hypothetical protein
MRTILKISKSTQSHISYPVEGVDVPQIKTSRQSPTETRLAMSSGYYNEDSTRKVPIRKVGTPVQNRNEIAQLKENSATRMPHRERLYG